MVKDVKDESKFYRADKLLEDVMEQKLAAKDVTEEQRVEYPHLENNFMFFSHEKMKSKIGRKMIKNQALEADILPLIR